MGLIMDGEKLQQKNDYSDNNCLTLGKTYSDLLSMGIINNTGNLSISYDTAQNNWRSSWKMPSKNQCQELWDNCKITVIEMNGKKGYKFIGPNNKSIFIPNAGTKRENGKIVDSAYGFYC